MAFGKIDPGLYENRNFSPVLDFERSAGQGPVETSDAIPNGLVCVAFTTPTRVGAKVGLKSGVLPNDRWTSAYAHGIWTMVSLTEQRGDFTYNASKGLEANLGAIVGKQVRGYVTLKPGTRYFGNVAYMNGVDTAQPGLRVQLTIQE